MLMHSVDVLCCHELYAVCCNDVGVVYNAMNVVCWCVCLLQCIGRLSTTAEVLVYAHEHNRHAMMLTVSL